MDDDPKKELIIKSSPISAGDTHFGILNQIGDLYVNKNGKNILLRHGVRCFHSSAKSMVIATKSGKIFGRGKFSNRISIQEGKELSSFPWKIAKIYHIGPHITAIMSDGLAYLISLTGYHRGKLSPFPFRIKDVAYNLNNNSSGQAGFYMVDLDGNLYSWNSWFKYHQINSSKLYVITPQLIKLPEPIQQVVLSEYRLSVLSISGQIYSWEDNFDNPHQKFVFPSKITGIFLRDMAQMAISEIGKLYVWGTNPTDFFKDQLQLTLDDENLLNSLTKKRRWKSRGIQIELDIVESPFELNLGHPIKWVTKGEDFILAVSSEGQYLLIRRST